MRKSIFFFAIAASLLLSACNNSEKKITGPEIKAKDSTTTEAKKEAPKGRYAIKSAIVEMKTEVMGFTQKQVLTFDDYGSKQHTEVTGEVLGQKTHSVNINIDGYTYSIDMIRKNGTKMKIPKNSESIDFENLEEGLAKEMNIKKVGTESFLNKTCDKYTIDDKKHQMKGSYLVWNGVALKTNITIMGLKSVIEATKVVENPSVSAELFEVPKGIKMKSL
jgi:hypothetical protein